MDGCIFKILSSFQNCMGIVYTVYMEGLGVSMETLIGNMVGYVQVPPPGGLQASAGLYFTWLYFAYNT